MTAFVIPKAVGNSVTRNRVRRRLREIYRHLLPEMATTSATVWIASRQAATATFADLAHDLLHLARKAKLIRPGHTFPEPTRSRWKLPPSKS